MLYHSLKLRYRCTIVYKFQVYSTVIHNVKMLFSAYSYKILTVFLCCTIKGSI